jgi:DNA-binding GntR family transcriptional regulator
MQVHDALLEQITTGRLEPGERLVIERLADQLGVSQTPVREAVARLVQEGLTTEAPNGRLQVVALTEPYVRDTFLVRGALEGLAAELAAPQISEAHLTTLQTLVAGTTAALAEGDYDVYVRTDASLHRLILEAANNSVLNNELQSLQPHVDLIRGYSQRNNGEHLRESHQEHLRIIDALAHRDPVTARQAMEQHIRAASARIIRLIDFHGRYTSEAA